VHREPGWPILIIALSVLIIALRVLIIALSVLIIALRVLIIALSALIIALRVLIIALRILIIALRVILLTDAWCSRHGGRRKVAGLLPLRKPRGHAAPRAAACWCGAIVVQTSRCVTGDESP
jgi:hypothetical protein